MRKLALTVALAAAASLTAPLGASAGAISPSALGTALDESRLVEPVHCRPGRWHHRYGPPDGCYRRVYRYHSAPRYYYQPYPYAYGAAPGVSFHFGVGPRHPYWGW